MAKKKLTLKQAEREFVKRLDKRLDKIVWSSKPNPTVFQDHEAIARMATRIYS